MDAADKNDTRHHVQQFSGDICRQKGALKVSPYHHILTKDSKELLESREKTVRQIFKGDTLRLYLAIKISNGVQRWNQEGVGNVVDPDRKGSELTGF